MDFSKQKYGVKKAYLQLISSIAFYPFMIAIGLLALSLFTSYLDSISIGESIVNKVSFLKINNANTARSLLSSLLTGLISLVTFTFAMVMIVLTQVTSSFSPRLLSNLIGKKGNQMVLGTMVGTICYLTVALSNIQTMASGPEVPLLSVALGMFLGFICILSFIYFIYKISNEIQIGNILNSQYSTTRNVLSRELDSGCYHENWEEEEGYFLVKAWDSGYFDTITEAEFKKQSQKLGLRTRLLVHQGMYLLKGEPFMEISLPMNDKIKEVLHGNILLRHQERVQENFIYGIKHLTEVAVKALSAAINDPGTAIQAIDYLLDLLCRLQALKGRKVITHEDGSPVLLYQPIPFEQIFYMCTASIRAYSAKDVSVQTRLVNLIGKIRERDEEQKLQSLLTQELNSIKEASTKEMSSEEDINYVRSLVQKTLENHKL